jgi:hypothetical protein
MLHDAHLQNLRRAFAAQFESNAAGYLYRRGGKGAPIQVSSVERDMFVDTFDRRMRRAGRTILIGIIALLGGLAIAKSGSSISDTYFYALVALLGIGMLVYYYWSRAAPARALVRRSVLGNSRSVTEARSRLLAALRWQILATGALAGVVLTVLSIDEKQSVHLRIAGMAFGMAILALCAVQAIRKWRARRHP